MDKYNVRVLHGNFSDSLIFDEKELISLDKGKVPDIEWFADFARVILATVQKDEESNTVSKNVSSESCVTCEEERDRLVVEVERLREVLLGVAARWCGHSGSCCTLADDKKTVIVTPSSCRCYPEVRAVHDIFGAYGTCDDIDKALKRKPLRVPVSIKE